MYLETTAVVYHTVVGDILGIVLTIIIIMILYSWLWDSEGGFEKRRKIVGMKCIVLYCILLNPV